MIEERKKKNKKKNSTQSHHLHQKIHKQKREKNQHT